VGITYIVRIVKFILNMFSLEECLQQTKTNALRATNGCAVVVVLGDLEA